MFTSGECECDASVVMVFVSSIFFKNSSLFLNFPSPDLMCLPHSLRYIYSLPAIERWRLPKKILPTTYIYSEWNHIMSYKKTREPLPYLSADVLSLYLTFSPILPTVHLVAFVDRSKPIPKKPEKGKNTTFLCRRSMIKLSNTGAFLSSLVVFLLYRR